MSKSKITSSEIVDQIAATGLRKQAGLKVLGAVVAAGSKNDRLPKNVRRTLKTLRQSIADAEKRAKKEASKGKAKRARKRLGKQLKASATQHTKAAAKGAAKRSAKASAKASAPVIAAKSGKKVVRSTAAVRRGRKKPARR
jgi:hypothetical protein